MPIPGRIALVAILAVTLAAAAIPSTAQVQYPIRCFETIQRNDDVAWPPTASWDGVGVADDGWIQGQENEVSGNGWSGKCWEVTVCRPRAMRFQIHDLTLKPGHYYELWVDGSKFGETSNGLPAAASTLNDAAAGYAVTQCPGPWGYRGCEGRFGQPSNGDFNIPLSAGVHYFRIRFAGFDGHTEQEVRDCCMHSPSLEIKWSWPIGKVVAQGRFAYRDSVLGYAQNPMRSIGVALFDKDPNGGERCLETSTTDANGSFVFPCQTNYDLDGGPLDLFVRAYFRSDSSDFAQPFYPHPIIPVTVLKADTSIWSFDSEVKWDCQGIDPDHSVLDFKTQKPLDTDYPHNAAMHIYTTMLKGWDWVAARTNTVDPLADELMMGVRVFWDWEWGQQTQHQNYNIYVDGHGNRLSFGPDELDDNALLHEYGHCVALRYNFIAPVNIPIHSGTQEVRDAQGNPSLGGAWNEGWAAFFGCMTKSQTGDWNLRNIGWDRNNPVRSRETTSLETGIYTVENPIGTYITQPVTRFNSQGPTWEWPVAASLWDIFDTTNDNQPPNNACGEAYWEGPTHTYIFDACRAKGATLVSDIQSFYDRYVSQHNDTDTINRLRDLFCEHGITVVHGPDRIATASRMNASLGEAPSVVNELRQNRPNPFTRTTEVAFVLARPGSVRLDVFDLRGRLVRSLSRGESFDAGPHSLVWDRRDDVGVMVGPGVYLYRFETEGFLAQKKMILLP